MGAVSLVASPGCSQGRLDSNMVAATDAGRYGGARASLQARLTDDPADRNYILDRLRLLILTLADGSPNAAEQVANDTFRLLRTQGLNADRTTAAVVFNEGVKIWKGEPFEQALGYCYVAVQKAERGEWDNARAAAGASLFLLKDFGENEQGEELSNVEIARKAAEQDQEAKGSGDEYIDNGYTPTKTDFSLGYVLTGIASRALGRPEEAADNFREAATVNPALAGVVAELERGDYNTVFIVDYGRGPVKTAYGPDNAFAKFEPVQQTQGVELTASVLGPEGGGGVGSGDTGVFASAPPTIDINDMSAKHYWNNLEDVRTAKSVIGSALLVGGVAVAASADQQDDSNRQNQQLVGLGMMVLGAISKANAAADTRHVEFFPSSVFIVPIKLTHPDSTVALEVAGDGATRMVLSAVDPPRRGEPVQLRYVRLNQQGSLPWATAGEVVYANEQYGGRVEGETLPFIMGGRSVLLPSAQAMERYHSGGNLLNMTASDLENLYREEGIALSVEDQGGGSRKHVLEGGDSLVAPLAGTAGYQRLFGQLHDPYRPKSEALKEVIEQIERERGLIGEEDSEPVGVSQ